MLEEELKKIKDNTINKKVSFSEIELQNLFGHEAAEDESPERLKEYYVKTGEYEQIVSDLSLRILVGHKGIGKSALFKIAMQEDETNNILNILIKPDDIAYLGTEDKNFLQIIREWKNGLIEIIAKKILTQTCPSNHSSIANVKHYGTELISFVIDTFSSKNINILPTRKKFVENFINKNKINVYIDDLDRGWQGQKDDITRISALLNAVRDISSESRGINFRVSLRSDVYYLVRTSDESTDKIEGSVTWFSWTNHEIYVLLIKRIESFFGRQIDETKLLNENIDQIKLIKYMKPIMTEVFYGKGVWSEIPTHRMLMSLIRKRPRDLVKLCTLAGRKAREDKSEIILSQHFQAIFEEYSQGRLQDTINEYRSELPSIDRLLLSMKPSKREKISKKAYVFTTDELLKKLKDIISQGDFIFANKNPATPKQLLTFMYKINFLTARKVTPEGEITRKFFDENRYLSNEFSDFGFDWEIHPAYRWALQPDDINSIYQIKL
ncbi:P-loop ATPase, Sll1717 family [Aliarcobacter butzleri]|uniref:P-loop ATPase, Sll1717 family n=1 Tax=Aliarcobacter butzleri TaxID=28197 RepID=UPI003B2223EB